MDIAGLATDITVVRPLHIILMTADRFDTDAMQTR
jgi:hypothetical protein